MATTDRYAGTALYVSFAGTDLSADYTSVALNGEGKHATATAGSETVEYYLPLRKDATIDFEGFWNGGTAQSVFDAVVENAIGTLIVGPYGTVATYPKITINRAIVKSRKLTLPFDNAFKLAVTFQASANVTRDNWA